jgi:sulfite reductase (NADPH) flavoprotein alpha-component
MTSIPIIPESAPFTAEQRSWLNGFLAGVLSRGTPLTEGATMSSVSDAAAKEPLLVLFGSQSGNAESYAKRLAKEAAASRCRAAC